MDIVNVLANATVMVVVLSIFAYLGRERFELLGRRIDRLEDEVRRGFAAVDQRFGQVDQRFGQVDQRFLRVEAELAGLRSDLTRVALAVGARREPGTA